MNASEVALLTTVNEAATIGDIVAGLRRQRMDVLVVDAASDDGTAERAEEAGATVLRLPRVSIRHALLAGWEMALDNDGLQRLVQLDAGGSHNPNEAYRLLYILRRYNVDVVVGSRFRYGSSYHGRPLRRELSRMVALLCSMKTRAPLSDWTSGYRAWTAGALRVLVGRHYTASMHGWQIEVLGAALRQGLAITEAPISYFAGRSSMNWRIALEALDAWASL